MSCPVRRFSHLPPVAAISRGSRFCHWLGVWASGLLAAAGAEMTPRMLLLDAVRVSDEVIAVGEQGTIVRSVDRARTWQSVPAPTRATLTGVSFAPGGQHGWVVGHDALILGTRDSGRSWARRYQGESLQDSFLDVIALDETRAIAVGAYGLFVATADGGMTWERHPSPAGDFHLNRITRGPTGTLYLAGESGTLLRSRDEGRTWTPIRAPYEGSFYGVSALDETTLLAYGLRGHLYRSTDDGVHWSAVNAPEQVMLATSVHDGATISFAGQARTLFISRDGGRTVNKVTGAPATAIAELVLLAPGVLLAVGEAGVTRIELPRGSAPPP